MSNKEISMIVLNYNDADAIIEFVDSLEEEILKIVNLIIVDNHSTDDSFDFIQSRYGTRYDIIRTEKNNGYSAGNNFGIRYVVYKYNPKYIIVSNPDVVIRADVILKMLELFRNKTIKLVGCKMVGVDGKVQTYGWRLPKYSTLIGASLVGTNRFFVRNHNCYRRRHFESAYSIVDAVAGSFFIAECRMLEEVGYFDEDVFLYCEEDILAFKLKECNYKAAVLNTSQYVHKHSQTIGKAYANLEIYKIAQKSRAVYMLKYMQCGKAAMNFFFFVSKYGYLERKCLWTMYKFISGRKNEKES